MARGVSRAYGDPLRYLLADTDATSGSAGDPFILLGGGRLAGRVSGGDTVAAQMAAAHSGCVTVWRSNHLRTPTTSDRGEAAKDTDTSWFVCGCHG